VKLQNAYAIIANPQLCKGLVQVLQSANPQSNELEELLESVAVKRDVLQLLKDCIHNNPRAAAVLISGHGQAICSALGVVSEGMGRLLSLLQGRNDVRYANVMTWFEERFDLVALIFQCAIAEEKAFALFEGPPRDDEDRRIRKASRVRITAYLVFFRQLFVAINSSTFSGQQSLSRLLSFLLSYYHYHDHPEEDKSDMAAYSRALLQKKLADDIAGTITDSQVLLTSLRLNEVEMTF